MKLLVVGAGAAGVAAAYRAHARGAEVRVLYDRAGCTELGPGLVDLLPWTQSARGALDAACAEFIDALGLWSIASETLIATGSGVLRPARGADRALLNLAPLAGHLIGVPEVERDDWDARLLVRSIEESAWARETSTRFETVRVQLLQAGYERRISPHDFAELHDQPDRQEWFSRQLGEASAPDAWLTGPWLGVEPGTAQQISRRLGIPVGEAATLPGGPAGARFARARERLLQRLGIEVRQARVHSVKRRGKRWEAILADGQAVHAEAVVLAIGGVAAGGIVLESAHEQVIRGSFRLGLDAPVAMFVKQHHDENVASHHGFDFAVSGLGVLDQVGARVEPGVEGLFLAGDVMAGRPNTMLWAVRAGIAAADRLWID